MQAFAGTGADFDVLLGDTMLARIHFTVRTTPGQMPAFDRKELEAQLAAAARRWDDELRDALIDAEGEAARHRAVQALERGLPARLPRARAPRARAVPDVRKIAALSTDGAARARAVPAARRAPPMRSASRSTGSATPVVLSDSLPMLEHMGVRVLGEQQPPHRGGRRPVGVAARLRAAGAGRRRARARDAGAPVRGRLRARLPRRRRERRLQPPGAARRAWRPTRSWCCAPTRSTCKQIGFALSQAYDRGDARRAPAHRAHAGAAVQAALRSGQRATSRARPRRSTRSSRRSRRSATCPRTACCASCSR